MESRKRKLSSDSSSGSSSEEEETSFTKRFKSSHEESTTSSDDNKTESTSDTNSSDAQNKSHVYLQEKGNYSEFASRIMANMGYKAGKGLGAKQQGRVEIVEASNQRGRRGLGLRVKTLEVDVTVDWEDEKPPSAVETVNWIKTCEEGVPDYDDLCDWQCVGEKKLTIDDEDVFCDRKLLLTLLKCKSVFDELEGKEMRGARTRSNPYETIRGAFFLNRAAMKMANMDFVFDRMFTNPKNLTPHETLYFSDICAGPGGFSEYILWKKGYKAKGFGFTLKGSNDFKLEQFYSASSEFFEPHYGVKGVEGDGDIMNSDNLEEFKSFVLENTDGKGVHFVMADGGFSVEGQENIQEILTKQLLLCQFTCALNIVRLGGCFVCKTFDLFTPFSISLIYLLRRAFKDICIFKPVTSRPANSERYVVCKGYHDEERLIADYLISANIDLNTKNQEGSNEDIISLVPLDVIMADKDFYSYMKQSNEETKIETMQSLIRKDCLQLWEIPDKVRAVPEKESPSAMFKRVTGKVNPVEFLIVPKVLDHKTINRIEHIYDFRCYVSAALLRTIILSLGGARVLEWVPKYQAWEQLHGVNLCIPCGTILDVEVVQELKGEGKGQRHRVSVHVIDALMLAREDISKLHFTERMEKIRMFVRAIRKPSRTDITEVRVKEMFRTEEVNNIFKRLQMKAIKGQGRIPRLCYGIENSDFHVVPSGLCFVKIVKEPWTMAFSKTNKRKYFYNIKTKQSTFECPPNFSVPFEYCAKNRVVWPWVQGVRVHSSQEHLSQEALSVDNVVQFVHARSNLH